VVPPGRRLLLQHLQRQEITLEVIAAISEGLRQVEREVVAAGDMELWQVAAHYFGLDGSDLPEPKGIFYRSREGL
jgi:hypothetical protein